MANYRLLIDGKLVDGARTTPVVNPATEETIALCPRASEAQLNQATAAAKAAFPAWAVTPIEHRRVAVNKIADIIEAHLAELAHVLTTEQGKPLPDATNELHGTVAFFRYMASLDLPMRVIEDSGDRRVEVHRRPLGVVGAILPWNYPLLLVALKAPAALIAGNTMVLKTAPTTPLATLRLAELIVDVLPPGVLNIIADTNDLGEVMTRHPDIRKISFTGSTATGKKVMSAVGETLKRITLELGGNDAAIVLDDVDVKKAAEGVFTGAFENSGQVCLAIKRAYVHEAVYDQFCDELVTLANNTVVDDRLKQGTKLGPLQNKMQYEKVKASWRTRSSTAKWSPAARRSTVLAISLRRRSYVISRKARAWSTRSNSVRSCPLSNMPTLPTRCGARTLPAMGSADRCGHPIPIAPTRSPSNSTPARYGSTSILRCCRTFPSGAPSNPASARN
jgi:acyl-CoA reductase-like NAD-dependent aldehyde dehydrogenase